MLYVFLVDSGKMLTFDVNYAFKPVSYVKTAIWEDCGIPEDKQVLIVSGGECLDVNAKICTYSAGTDTNPIFLFNKLCIDNPLSMFSKIDSSIDIMLKEQVEGSLLLLPSYTTIVARTQLAQQLNEASRKELTACEKTVHDQHVMQQAWAAVTANLEDSIRAFELRAATMFSHYGSAYLHDIRPRYVTLVKRLPADCEILAELPFLVEAQQGDGPRPATMLNWIKSKDKNGDLLELVETCRKELERYNEGLLHEMRAEFTVALDATRNQAMKEIRGLEDRLYGLEQLLFEARSSLNQQNELTQGFLQNQHRASKENDASIFPDLCSSHKRQLLYMLKNHQHIKDISHRCMVAKEELASNLNARLRWVSFVEKQMCLVDGKICAHYKKLRELDTKCHLLQQIHFSPFLYVISLLEVNRRKKFSSAYAQVINVMWKRLQKAHALEKRKRLIFKRLLDNHFINSLLPCVDEDFSTYGISEEPPNSFDNALREMPDFALHDILPSKLSKVETGDSFAKILREVLRAETATKPSSLDDDEKGVLARDIKQFCSQRIDSSLFLDENNTENQPRYPLSLLSSLFHDLLVRPTATEECFSHETELEVLSKALCCVEPQDKRSTKSYNPNRLAKYLSSLYDTPKRDDTLVRSADSYLHTRKLRVGPRANNSSTLVKALVEADAIGSLDGTRTRFCEGIRLAHLNHKASRLYQEVRSLKQFAESNNESFNQKLIAFHQTLPRLISNHDRTSTQNFEALKQSLVSRYENVVREYEIKIELQEAASDDSQAKRESLELSRMTDTYGSLSSLNRHTQQQSLLPPPAYPGFDIPSFALKLELRAELVKAQCLARLAACKNQVVDLSERLRQKDAEIERLLSLQRSSTSNNIEVDRIAPEETFVSPLCEPPKIESPSPILGEAGGEGSYYFDDYDYGDGCEMTMIVSANDPPLPCSKAVLEAKQKEMSDIEKGELDGGEKREDDDMATLNFLQDTSSLLFLSSLDASNYEEGRETAPEFSPLPPAVPFFPEIPYLEPVNLALNNSSSSDQFKASAQTEQDATYVAARLEEYLELLRAFASLDLITTLYYHEQGIGGQNIRIFYRDFCRALHAYHEYARFFNLTPATTNIANLEHNFASTELTPNAETNLLQTLSQLGTESEDASCIDSRLIPLAFIENFLPCLQHCCELLPKNTKVQSVSSVETKDLLNQRSLGTVDRECFLSRLDYLNLEKSQRSIIRPAAIISSRSDTEATNVCSLSKSVNVASLLESSLCMPIISPDPCQVTATAPSSSTTKSHNHQPKITLNNCSVGDVVLFYRDKEHRDNFVAYCLDREKHFLHSDSFATFGLDNKGSSYNSFNSHDNANIILGRVLSKELCLAKKYPNRFQIPLGTKFYRVRLGPLPPAPPSAPHQGSQIIVERFVTHSKTFYDKICK